MPPSVWHDMQCFATIGATSWNQVARAAGGGSGGATESLPHATSPSSGIAIRARGERMGEGRAMPVPRQVLIPASRFPTGVGFSTDQPGSVTCAGLTHTRTGALIDDRAGREEVADLPARRGLVAGKRVHAAIGSRDLSLIHISEPTRRT